MPSTRIWLDSRLRDISIESKNKTDFGRGSYGHPKLALLSSFPRQGLRGQRRLALPEQVGSAIFEYQMPSKGMWSYCRLKEISIESKNT